MDSFWWGLLLCGRILPAILVVPAFGGNRLPVVAKVALAAVLSLAVFPAAKTTGPAPEGMRFFLVLAKELSVGAVLALAGSCLFEAFRMAGESIDTLRGCAAATSLIPQSDEHASPLGDLHLLLAVVIFFKAGGPGLFLGALGVSLEQLPLANFPSGAEGGSVAALALVVTGEAIRMGVTIAFPAAAAILLADVLLGFINRTAPQLPVFFVGMPVKAALGIAVVALSLDHSVGRLVAALAPDLAGFRNP